MPFKEVTSGPNKGKYRSPSGRLFTKDQVKLYHSTGGFQKSMMKGEHNMKKK